MDDCVSRFNEMADGGNSVILFTDMLDFGEVILLLIEKAVVLWRVLKAQNAASKMRFAMVCSTPNNIFLCDRVSSVVFDVGCLLSFVFWPWTLDIGHWLLCLSRVWLNS